MFGKRIAEYLDFQKVILGLLAAVGLVKLGLSVGGVPDSTLKWLPMNVVAWAGALYYGVAVHTKGFGSYKQILPLALFQMVVQQAIAVLGILLAIAGFQNIYAAPEYSIAGQSQWVHIAAHLTVGIVVATLLLWAVASLVLLITKKVARQPAVA
jgi:hypothetical protein